MSLHLVETINFGYGHLEPVIIGLMATHKNFLFIGRHGSGKSRIAKVLSQGYGKKSYVLYDATKDDLISIAGIPNPKAIQEGKLDFTPHQRTIWDKSTVVVDEITRASKENQNLWLEIMEERTCFGIPLSYRTLIATANPESYAAAFQLDDALMDRFSAVMPIPDLQENMDAHTVEQLLQVSIGAAPQLEPERVARVFSEVQSAHVELTHSGAMNKIIAYCAAFFSELLQAQCRLDDQEKTYISARTYGKLFPEAVLAVAAYHTVAGTTEPLQSAAADCVRYCLATKYKLNDAYLMQLHQAAKGLLSEGELSEGEKMRYAIATLRSFEDRLGYLQDNHKQIIANLQADELEKFLGTMLQGASREGEKEKLVHLKQILNEIGYTGDILRQVDGNLILTLNSAVSTFIPLLNKLTVKPSGKTAEIWKQIENFKHLVEQGEFTKLQTNDAVKLKAFIIDVYEEDIEPTEENLKQIFQEINLETA